MPGPNPKSGKCDQRQGFRFILHLKRMEQAQPEHFLPSIKGDMGMGSGFKPHRIPKTVFWKAAHKINQGTEFAGRW